MMMYTITIKNHKTFSPPNFVSKSSVLQATLVTLMCVRYVKKVAQSGNN